jgi:UDP-arabinose 4-epimerase
VIWGFGQSVRLDCKRSLSCRICIGYCLERWASVGSRTNILVTGGAGYIGSHTIKALFEAGYYPVVLDNLTTGHRWAVKWGTFIQGDVANTAMVTRILEGFNIQAVVHFAGSAYVGESVRDPRKYYRNNVITTLQLLDAMITVGVKHIVFSSSCATYGIPSQMPISEDHPQNPINPYGQSKLSIEQALRWYGDAYDLTWTALRYFNAAGADLSGEIGEAHDPETHLIPLCIEASLGRRPYIEVFGTDFATPDGTAVRDYIHVGDLAAAHETAVEYLLQGGKSDFFNLGTCNGCSVLEIVEAVQRVGHHPVEVREAPRRPGDPPILVADNAKARRVLGWTPHFTDIDAIIRTAYRWHESLSMPLRQAYPIQLEQASAR